MRDRGFRLDAVAKVEDQSPSAGIRQHVINSAIQRVTARDQYQWVEIALHRNARLNPFTYQRRFRRPVDADRVDSGCIRTYPGSNAAAPREEADDPRARHLLRTPSTMRRVGSMADQREFARWENTGPGVENLRGRRRRRRAAQGR